MAEQSNRITHPELSDAQIDRLRPYGQVRPTQPGDVLFQEGDVYDFFVVLDGAVEIVDRSEDEEKIIAVDGPGLFLGELSLMTGQSAYLMARVRGGGAVLVMPPERLKTVVAEEPELGDLILNAFIARRAQLLEEAASTLKIIGSRFSAGTLRLREFAVRNQLPHAWLDLEEDEGADALLQAFGVPPDATPVVIWQGEEVLKNPSVTDLARRVGLSTEVAKGEVYDLIVVGAGPAGLAASVYGASEGLKTITLEATATGGQAGSSSRIENFFGFPSGLSGADLTNRGAAQARKFGARLVVPSEAVALRTGGGAFVVERSDGEAVSGRSILIATGARYRKLELERLKDLEGAGVYYGATETEAQACRDSTAVVVGGGNSAGQAAVFLARRARRVLLLIRGDDLSKSMSRYLARRVEGIENIELMTHTEVRRLCGEDRLEEVAVENNRTGEERVVETSGLFVFIGAEPRTDWLNGALALDENGFVVTGNALKRQDEWAGMPRDPLLLETSVPGIFAAGDVRAGSVKRVASAVGEGSIAVKFVHQHLGT